MAECQISFSIDADLDTSEINFVITDAEGNILLQDTAAIKPIIQKCLDEQIQTENKCYAEQTQIVPYFAGPGAADSYVSAVTYRVNDLPTLVCVADGDSGREEMWWILNDINGNPQWHQDDG